MLERAAKNTGDEKLLSFASYLREHKFCAPEAQVGEHGALLYRQIADLFMVPEKYSVPFTAPETSWFERIQVVTARDSGNTGEGFFFSAKGGHNGESHNHNDIGNFILYYNAQPVIIDAGPESYTRFTFSDQRYTLWNMQSRNHNCPAINGLDQADGTDRRAQDVACTGAGGITQFSLELGGAYPEDAGVNRYKREFVFTRGAGLRITDTYSLKEWKAPLVLNLLCHDKPDISESRAVLSGKVILTFEGTQFKWEIDELPLIESKMRGSWKKDTLYRLRLIKQDRELSRSIQLGFSSNCWN